MVIGRGDLAEDAATAQIDRFTKLITDQGGTVDNVDNWGKRAFAYEIDHMTEGYYAVVDFQVSSEGLAELDRQLGITDGVVRHKIVRPGVRTKKTS